MIAKLLARIKETEEVQWRNPYLLPLATAIHNARITAENVKAAEERLRRFEPYIAKVFPQTNGVIESPLVAIPAMEQHLQVKWKLLLKCDSHLSISGSIKARGGIYEVLKHAEQLAVRQGMLALEDCYSRLDSEVFRTFFSQYRIAVGSTGNLGLSIGIKEKKPLI